MPACGAPASASAPSQPNEDKLRQQLRAALHSLKKREPLDDTYKRLLMNNPALARPPRLPRDPFYRRIHSNLRPRVERYMVQMAGKDPFDRIAQRQPLEDSALRAALSLRESKEHEQQALLEATLVVQRTTGHRYKGMPDDNQRKRYFEGIALSLQNKKAKMVPMACSTEQKKSSAAEQTEQARQKAQLELKRKEAREREEQRKRKQEEAQRKRMQAAENAKRSTVETPQQALHKIVKPIFTRLWETEFENLGGTNPFRIVIDRDNCARLDAPDYFDVIQKPMNLTFIQQKVNQMDYNSLRDFFDDCELMIKNAITYNSDPTNPYRIAAEEMKKKYFKLRKKILLTIQQKRKG